MLVDELVLGAAAVVDEILAGLEDAVRRLVIAGELPPSAASVTLR